MKKIITVLVLISIFLSAEVLAATVIMTWSKNAETDLAGYKIYRATVPGGYTKGTPIATVTTPKFTDSTVSPRTTYYYVVTAFDKFGNESPFSNEVVATIRHSSTKQKENISSGEKIEKDS